MLEGLPEMTTIKREHYREMISEVATLHVLIDYLKEDRFEDLDDIRKYLGIEVKKDATD